MLVIMDINKMDMTFGPKRMFEITLFIAFSFTLLLSSIVTSSHGQAPTLTPPTTPSQEALPAVKITSIEDGDSVPVLGNLTISGTSSDDVSSTCQVSVIVNDVKPYQPTIATGSRGPADYSEWKFIIASNYTSIKKGENEITSKVVCPGNGAELTKWYGVNVTGVDGASSKNAHSSSEQSNESGSSTSSVQSNGPVYSYSKQNATNKTSDSGKFEVNQENEVSSSESTQSTNGSNNSAGVRTNFVPPFSP